jgi:succinate dehydrogenase / fumarate reductase, cytochrome b subunit
MFAMTNKKRPLSPHLQIYKPQITSIVSIFHRMSGAFMAMGLIVLTYWLGAAAYGPEAYGRALAVLDSWFVSLVLYALMAAYFYHLLNGIRHLVWDTGRGLEKDQVTISGTLVIAGTVILTAAVLFLA